MCSRVLACAALLGALISSSARPAVAQVPARGGAAKSTSAVPSARAEPDARTLFEQGRAALTTGRFAEARDLFRRALVLLPKPGSAFNLAVALRGTGEAKEAVATLEALLGGAYGELDRARRAEAEALRAQAQADLASIRVTLESPVPARVRLDGREVLLPADGRLVVDAGTYALEATAPGHHTAEARAEVARGGTADVRLVLAPVRLTATLILEGEPEDRLRVVGVAEGRGRLERALDPGTYQLEADGPAGLRTTEAQLLAGQTLRVQLVPEERPWPWLWIGLGGAALVAGTIAAVVVASGSPDPITDPTYGVIQTLHGR